MDSPTGIAANPLFDDVFVADFKNHRIQVFDFEGRFRRQWGSRGDGNGQFDNPFGVVVDQTPHVLVTDFDNHRVQVFTVEGEFITAFGSKGDDPGEFNNPTGIAVDIPGNVFVVDTDNNRVQKFSPA